MPNMIFVNLPVSDLDAAKAFYSALGFTLNEQFSDERTAVKRGDAVGLVLNAAAYTHTSVALHDAIEGAELPTVEVHISNVHGRETFRHHSFVSPVAAGIVVGFGVDGYALAIDGLVRKVRPLRAV